MFVLPDDVVAYKRTRDFDEGSVPAGLRRRHNTREGVWGRIVVTAGKLRYVVEDGPSWTLEPGVVGVVRPREWHHVEPLGPVCFHVEFLRAPD